MKQKPNSCQPDISRKKFPSRKTNNTKPSGGGGGGGGGTTYVVVVSHAINHASIQIFLFFFV
jgi:hypothetical protein